LEGAEAQSRGDRAAIKAASTATRTEVQDPRFSFENRAILPRLDPVSINAGDFFQILDGFEISVLLAVLNDCGSPRAFERQATFQFNRCRFVDVDFGQSIGGEILDQIIKHGADFIVSGFHAGGQHLANRCLPSCSIQPGRNRPVYFVTGRSELLSFCPAWAVWQ
jgi:hypothetical protein